MLFHWFVAAPEASFAWNLYIDLDEINEFSWKHRDFNHETLGFNQKLFTWIIDLSNQVDFFEHLGQDPLKIVVHVVMSIISVWPCPISRQTHFIASIQHWDLTDLSVGVTVTHQTRLQTVGLVLQGLWYYKGSFIITTILWLIITIIIIIIILWLIILWLIITIILWLIITIITHYNAPPRYKLFHTPHYRSSSIPRVATLLSGPTF